MSNCQRTHHISSGLGFCIALQDNTTVFISSSFTIKCLCCHGDRLKAAEHLCESWFSTLQWVLLQTLCYLSTRLSKGSAHSGDERCLGLVTFIRLENSRTQTKRRLKEFSFPGCNSKMRVCARCKQSTFISNTSELSNSSGCPANVPISGLFSVTPAVQTDTSGIVLRFCLQFFLFKGTLAINMRQKK